LQNGIYIDHINIPNIKIKQLYIKWNEKINISIEDIKIVKKEDSKSNIDYENIKDIFNNATVFKNWFENVKIVNINYNDINASFNYSDGEDGFLIAYSNNFRLKSSLHFGINTLITDIEYLEDVKRDIKIDGKIILDNNLNTVFLLNAQVNDEIDLKIHALSTRNKLFYKLESLNEIKSIKRSVDSFNLSKKISYWIIDAIDMSYLKIKKAHGWIDYKDINNAYKNIYVNSYIKELNYTYNKKLDAIHTKITELEYKEGILYIRPKNAYSYKQFLNKSVINIDFTKPKEELLTIHLLFNGKLNKDILKILEVYKIKLPFLQKRGVVATNLKIFVGLRNIDVQAKGDFFAKKANFDYLGLNIDISDAYIRLDNYDVKISDMLASYKNSIKTKVNVTFNAKKSIGKINFLVKSVHLQSNTLSLKKKNLKIEYIIKPNNDKIKVDSSSWSFKNKIVHIESIETPFDIKKLKLKIPMTYVKSSDVLALYISGELDLKTFLADFNVDLLKLNYNGLKMAQSNAQLKLLYNKNFKINFPKTFHINAQNIDCTLDNTSIDIRENRIDIKSKFSIDEMIYSSINLKYNIKREQGNFVLNHTNIDSIDFGEIYRNKEKLKFSFKVKNNLIIKSKDLNSTFTLNNKKWLLEVNSVKNIAKNSDLLQKLEIDNGTFKIEKKSSSKFLNFNSTFIYPHKIIVIDNKSVSNYFLKGKVNTKNKVLSFKLNDIIAVNMDKNIKISLKNIGINVNELIDIFDSNSSHSNNKIDLSLNAKNCFLYISENRHIISDSISLQYYENILTAQLKHAKGKAGFKLQNEHFHLYGENFNDIFMDNLFALSKFKGGIFDFSMNGELKEYEGIFNIKNTVILDYKILNNILAFVNTIPSLLTFSLPGYNKNGLEVNNTYMNFTTKNDTFYISDIYLDSKEIDILGRGNASFKNNNINLKLNLKTDLGSAISKIPVVGYLLFNDDSISTSLSITGELSDPDVESLIAEELIVAPLNIIKRTLMLPYHLISGDKEESK